jgi:hypothetical protein
MWPHLPSLTDKGGSFSSRPYFLTSAAKPDLELAVSQSFPELRERDDDDAVRLLWAGGSSVTGSVRVFEADAEALLAADLKRRSPIWTLAEDIALLTRVIECGGLYKKLTTTWFNSTFSPIPSELVERNVGALVLRFNYLREELLFQVAKAHREGKQEVSWEWLEEKHNHSLSKDYYSYEDDLAICQLVVDRGMVGKKIGQKWFRENLVGRVPLLQGRGAAGLYGRYSKRLAKMLSSAVSAAGGGEVSYEWLREMHGIGGAEGEDNDVVPQDEDTQPAPRPEDASRKRLLLHSPGCKVLIKAEMSPATVPGKKRKEESEN